MSAAQRDPYAGPPDRPMRPGNQRLVLRSVCVRCCALVAGWIEFDPTLRVADTEAFMLFDEGLVCDPCIVKDLVVE